ncbi:hypothetical protein KIN20_025734 [Parelaphostrongylus tenuis]|uniref:Protein FMC1 homolog n=1 Tax=Parelaphostrongylus tenuis TaxID=148309 RepID=A0AAD5QWS8_PARTN|nr:hypothetical protein KIN20_007076 [Parelaphostrongylus tenuis]KAJ1365440.1 hypothetical protein KIN20_025734 [Parelaphostrongylus tenuis]
MMEAVEKSVLSTFRRVVKELRKTDKCFNRNSTLYKYLVHQVRDSTTERVYSKAPEETRHLANLYAAYLSSTRKLKELETRYCGGERSVEETARLVGLALPKEK